LQAIEEFSWGASTPSSSSALLQVPAQGSAGSVATSIEETMTSAGVRGKGSWWRLARKFLEHRLSLPAALAALTPTAILAPVPSENYLRQLMLRGFPPPATWQDSETPSSSTSFSLALPELFSQRVKGRRLAVLGLYLPAMPNGLVPAAAVKYEEAQAWAYLRGEQSLEVASNQQLLPLYVIEI